MCHFLSGVIDKATGQKLYFGQLNSHSGIEAGHSLKPDSYREFEWTEDDDGDSLVVRVSDMDKHDSEWYKEKILSKYPTRSDLLKYISTIVCKTDKLNEYRYDDKGVKISSGSWYENGQKREEIRYNDKGVQISYDLWYSNGQKYVERRYNENGVIVSYDEWYKNGQKSEEYRYNENGVIVSYDEWYKNGQKVN